MARQRMVTRTVIETVAEIMGLNIETCECIVAEYTVTGDFDSPEEVLKSAKKSYETEKLKLVKVNKWETKEVLYGMPEADFIKLAKILPPRGTKAGNEWWK